MACSSDQATREKTIRNRAMKPKLGDRIIVTDPKLDVEYGRECVVIDTLPLTNYIDTKPTEEPKEDVLLTRDQYQVLEKHGAKVVVGDRVIITRKDWMSDYLRVPVVREVRGVEGFLLAAYEDPDEDVGKFRLSNHEYRILKRGSSAPSSFCPDCNGTGAIQLFTSTVKCRCSRNDEEE